MRSEVEMEDVNEVEEGSLSKRMVDLTASDREIRREIKMKPLQMIHGLEQRVLLQPQREAMEKRQPVDYTNLTDTD